jgi:DNA-directed RNA polymerase subunit RPC12/RpoP
MSTVIDIRTRTTSTTTLDGRVAEEDYAEDAGLLAADDRLTCHVHGRWIHQCVSSSVHVNQITRHRWCRDCRTELRVAVDELTRTVQMACPRCGDGRSAATDRLVRACNASLAYTLRRAA